MESRTYSIEVGGKKMTAEFNDLANQADGSVLLSSGGTTVLATAVMSENPSNKPYFPLRVDYEERFYAAGEILGSRFIRREGRPSDEAVLSGRVVDRTIRPLFDHRLRHDVQVVITILSIDKEDPDILAVNAASLALATSQIPWNSPVSAVRIGKHTDKEELRVNPAYHYRESADFEMDLMVCGKDKKVNMIEVGAEESSNATVTEGLKKAEEVITKLQDWQHNIVNEIGKTKREVEIPEIDSTTKELFKEHIQDRLKEAVFTTEESEDTHATLRQEWKTILEDRELEEQLGPAMDYFERKVDALVHSEAITNKQRQDGRGLDEVRPLYADAGSISPKLHGSGTFYRGGTHILSVLTLGSPEDIKVVEGMEIQEEKRFFHHYNFPPFSVGDTGRVGGFNRRQIGHGALAEKAVRPVIPSKQEFPYTIRIVSEALASNGSTSMGSVCGSSLALMDAGVPITKPVAGIAMGLMYEDDENYEILTDIQGPEDHHGDMDFKVAGTRDGITAIQMDVKLDGIPLSILKEALERAEQARFKILDVMEEAISKPRERVSVHAPLISVMQIDPEKIGLVIGSGGKTINDIKDVSGVEEIKIEDDGTIYITGTGKDGEEEVAMAKKMIEDITREYEKGQEYTGEVTRIMDFGAFVKIGYDTEGLVHISEIAPFHVASVDSILHVGDTVPVIIKEIDKKGRINLSIKEIAPDFAKKKQTSKK